MMPDDPHEQRRHDEQARAEQTPTSEREPLRPVDEAEVPDAVEAASTDQQAETTRDKVQAQRARGVEWVRPTDLFARSSAALSGRGIDLQSKLAKGVDRGIVAGTKRLASAAKKLPPLSSFGRGRTHEPPTRSAVGRS